MGREFITLHGLFASLCAAVQPCTSCGHYRLPEVRGDHFRQTSSAVTLGLVTSPKMAGEKGLTSLVLHPLDSGIPYQSMKKTSPRCMQPVLQESHSNHSL